MSVSIDRRQSARSRGWVGRFQVAAMIALGLVLAFLTGYHLIFKDKTFVDPEGMSVLREQDLRNNQAKASGDWPQWRGPHRDGVSAETGLLATWPESGPTLLWEQPVGKGYSSLAIAAGRVFTLMQDGPNESAICWDAATGAELWRFSYPAKYRNAYGDGPRATPTVDGDRVYVVGATGIMHCLKTHPRDRAGEMIWRHDLLDEFGAANLQWGVSFSPLVHDGLVYSNPGGPDGKSMAALDKLTGKLRWQAGDEQAGYSSPVAAVIAGRPQVVFFTAAGLVGLTPDRGEVLWRFSWETSYGANVATPIVVRDYIFVSSGYNRGCAVVRIDKSGPEFRASRVYENKNMRNHFSSSVFFKDHVYGFNETLLTCLEFRTGKVKWKQRGLDKGSLLIADGALVILGEDGKLALADAVPDGYREKASFQVSQERCWTMPALANGRLYIRDQHKVRCLDVSTRTTRSP